MLRLSQLWSFLSFLWSENGSILDPDGGPKPTAAGSGDTGSGLDPNGTLERLLAADRTAEQNEQLFHLLAVCPRCREVAGWLLDLHQSNALPPVFGPIDAALARSRAEAPRLLEELHRDG